MKKYLRRFRRYLSEGGGNSLDVNNEFDDDVDEAHQSMLPAEDTLLSPLGRASSTRHSFGGTARKLKRTATTRTSNSAKESNAHESSEEENSAARLSRRSSVLVDLFALFRRSSSIGHSGRFQPQRFRNNDEIDESEEEDGEYQEMSKEKLLEAIRQKKEIIGKVRLQPWDMRRKRRTLKVAQRHLQRQKAQVSKWHLYKVELHRRLKQFWRWIKNMGIYLIPWESKIKRIESHFGSVVSSYFIFLRWVLSVNITMSMILLFFVTIPEWLADMQADPERFNRTQHIKIMPPKVRQHADELNTILDFGGYLQYSYLFYGYYSSETFFGNFIQYNVPIAYFCVNLFLLAFCLFIILKKMTSNTRKSKLSSGKQEQYVFTWKVFTGWDYNIGNPETSSSLFKANVIKLQEATADYNKKIKQKWTWMTFVMRILVNTVIICMFALSVYAIYQVAQITEKDTFLKQNAVSITVVVTTLLFPPIFELILRLESYRPRTALRTHLFRVLFFYLINYFTLIYSLFKMLNNLEAEMRANEVSNRFLVEQPTESFQTIHNPYSFNQSYYEVVPSRSSRQLSTFHDYSKLNETVASTMSTILGISSSPPFVPFVYYSNVPTTTTMEPPRPWTTVFPNFGPFGVGVYNPKAIVMSDKKIAKQLHETVYESRAIGTNADWSPAKATQGPVILNYTNTPRRHYQMYRSTTKYDDLCWETLIGQEITKIVTTDLVLTIVAILVIDFLRDIWIRYCGRWWCWDIEDTFPEYAEFKVAENVLHLVNNQGMIWLGTILVPMLPMMNNLNLIILMYIRAWACMTCNVPARQIFRASRSSNFYLWILLLMLCMSTLPVGFVIASKKPSKNCGPFGGQERFYSVISEVLHNNLNKNIFEVIQYIMSPGIVIPVLLLMLLIIYFLVLLVSGLKAANTDLSKQLTHERTEEKKKIFELAGGGRKRHSQFTFHRPSDSRVQDGNNSYHSSPRSRSIKELSESSQRKNRNGGSIDSVSEIDQRNGHDGPRTSWHGRTAGQRAAFSSSPDGKKEWEGAYKKKAAGIRRTATERPERTNLIENPFLFRNSSSEEQLNSFSKSPISPTRYPLFLPSLKSVNEDEVDDEASNKSTGKKSNGSNSGQSVSKTSHSENDADNNTQEEQLVKLSLKQKMMVWIGLADPKKIKEQERNHQIIAKNKSNKKDVEESEDSEDDSDNNNNVNQSLLRGKREDTDVENGLNTKRHMYRHDKYKKPEKSALRSPRSKTHRLRRNSPPAVVVNKPGSNTSSSNDRNDDQRGDSEKEEENEQTLLLNSPNRRSDVRRSPVLLEEADYSLASDEVLVEEEADDEEDYDDEAEEEIIIVTEEDSTTASIRSAKVFATDDSRSRSASRKSNNRIAVNLRESNARREPSEKDRLKLLSQKIPLKRCHSGSEDFNPKTNVEADDVMSECSPVVGRQKQDFFPTENNKFAPEKRLPQNKLQGAKSSTKFPAKRAGARVRRQVLPDLPHKLSDPSPSNKRNYLQQSPRFPNQFTERNDRGANTMQQSDDLTLAPSEESSFRDTSPLDTFSPFPYGDNGDTGVLSDSFRYSDLRLAYANPYSSYAAAMCSPISISQNNYNASNQNNRMSSSARFYHPSPQRESHKPVYPAQHPMHDNKYLRPLPYSSLRQDFALSQSRHESQLSRYENPAMSSYSTTNEAFPPQIFSTAETPGYYGQPQQTNFYQPQQFVHSEHCSPFHDRQLAANEKFKQYSPMYQHVSQRSALPEEDGSTSGRGTLPPSYYTESPSGSSPEFSRPKYRIASGHRQDQDGHSADNSYTGVRRFNIRQKSALGMPSGVLSEKSLSSSPTLPTKANFGVGSNTIVDVDLGGGERSYSQQTTV